MWRRFAEVVIVEQVEAAMAVVAVGDVELFADRTRSRC